LEENLAEIGLKIEDIPLVLQYNKRDLPDVCTVDELNRTLNRCNWPSFEASAIRGEGVFETLKGISKLTLMAIKQKMQKSSTGQQPAVRGPGATGTMARNVAGSGPRPAVAAAPAAPPSPAVAPAPAPQPIPVGAAAAAAGSSSRSAVLTAPAATAAPATAPAAPAPRSPAKQQVDAMAELERIRRQATTRMRTDDVAAALAAPAPAPAAVAPPANGHRELSHQVAHALGRDVFQRARRLTITVHVEDGEAGILGGFRDQVALNDVAALNKLLLHLEIALKTRD
jgi:hypothetical protein